MPIRGFQWDLARQVERLDWLLAQLPRYASWGYQELHLHIEDAFEFPSLPGIARRDAYSRRDMDKVATCADRNGLKVVPIVNLLGHTQYLIKDPGLRELNELLAPDGTPLDHGQLCPLHPRTPEVISRLLRDIAPYCTAGKVHVGLDESYHLGRHPLCRAEIETVGMAGHFARHVDRIHGIAAVLGLRIGIWADMLALLPEAIALLPADVIAYDWYYHPFQRTPRVELRNFSGVDLAPALRARGIEYWGCPMSGAFRHEPLPICRERLANIADWWRRCLRTEAAGMLVTSWEPSRLAAEIPEVIDAAAAGLWLDGERHPYRLLEGGCKRLFGTKGPRAAVALRMADEVPFSGYARWRVNARWDTVAGDGRPAHWSAEARACRALAARGGLPTALAASLRFRSYLAARDEFVRSAARGVWRVRAALGHGGESVAAAGSLLSRLDLDAKRFARLLAGGRSAARAMWGRTRNAKVAGPNECLVAEDTARLKAWRTWLRRCIRKPGVAWDNSPVVGAWQLLATVKNFAPALQKVVVEKQGHDGSWADVDELFMIEFRARSARSRANVTHQLSVPIAWRGPPSPMPVLRIAVRGFGQVQVSRIRLTNGVTSFTAPQRKAILGQKAPRTGFPVFDFQMNRGELPVRF
jgi:hypothetical protein